MRTIVLLSFSNFLITIELYSKLMQAFNKSLVFWQYPQRNLRLESWILYVYSDSRLSNHQIMDKQLDIDYYQHKTVQHTRKKDVYLVGIKMKAKHRTITNCQRSSSAILLVNGDPRQPQFYSKSKMPLVTNRIIERSSHFRNILISSVCFFLQTHHPYVIHNQ